MLKHITIIILLSVLVLLAMPQAQLILQTLLAGHDWIAETLKQVFSVGQIGNLIRESIALLAIPFLVGLVPTGVFWLIKRRWFPYFIYFVWFTWLVQTAALIAIYSPKK
jgi:hypothetical protein